MATITAKEARQGEVVTTVNNLNGYGLGYLVNGQVYQTTGTCYAVLASKNVCGLKTYHRDGGALYKQKVRNITGYRV